MSVRRHWQALIIGITGVFLLLSLAPAAASSANISHSYRAKGEIKIGSLVSLVSGQTNQVQAANIDNGQSLIGVAVSSSDSLLAVDPAANMTQVATDGTVNTLVSNVNGSINSGDQVAVSPFDGVGMKASPGSRIIGLAQTSFNIHTNGSSNVQVADRSGHQQTITVGYVRVSLAIGTASSNAALNGLQKIAVQLTGHRVSVVRLVISLVIAVVSLVFLISLTYAAIYGSIISIGRNPLAKFAVYRTLQSVIAMVVATAVIAALLIYLLLR